MKESIAAVKLFTNKTALSLNVNVQFQWCYIDSLATTLHSINHIPL